MRVACVLDAELLGVADGRVGGDRLGTAHDVDGVDVELAGHARGLLVRAVAEHADAGHEHDERVRAAHGRAVGDLVLVVVSRVVLAVGLVQLFQARDGCLDRGARGQIQQHRLDLGPQEVVGAGSPQRCEFGVTLAREEVEDNLAISEMANHRTVG